MATTVKINGIPIVIQRESLRIKGRIEERSIASFIVIDKPGTANYVRGMPIEIYDSVPTLIFGGFIDTPGRARISGSGLLHDIICMDNHYLADKRLVVKSYADKTLKYIVEDIATDILAAEGVTIGEVQTGPTIKAAVFNHIKVSEAYDALKELSGFTWYIDELKKLYFIDRTTNAAPWNLDGTTHRAIRNSVHLSTGNPLYRNFQYVWGGTDITTVQVLNFVGDGDTKVFTLSYPLAKIPVVEENDVPKSVGVKGLDTGKDYYWNKGDATIFAEVAPGVGVGIEVTYYGQFPLVSASIDSAAIVARAAIDGSSGIVEDIAREAWHESREASRQSAQAKLTQYCQDAEKFIYQTHESGLSPGQLQGITYSPFGFDAHGMLIESISVTADGDLITYTITCITGPSMGSWRAFFKKLLTRQDQSIRVGGDLLLKLLVEPESLGLAEAPALTSHVTKDYHWDDVDAIYGFATWA